MMEIVGTKPSVIDIATLMQLDLEDKLIQTASKVYGLRKNPVKVNCYVDVTIRIGELDLVIERMQVLTVKRLHYCSVGGLLGHLGR